jgi:hypothetical protein
LRRATFPGVIWVSGEYRWFAIVPPFVIQFVVGRLASVLDEKAGEVTETVLVRLLPLLLLLPLLPPQAAATSTTATTRRAVIAVAKRFICPSRPFDLRRGDVRAASRSHDAAASPPAAVVPYC